MGRKIIAIGMLLVAALFGFASAVPPAVAQGAVIVIPINAIKMRNGPDTKFQVLATVPAGTQLTAIMRTRGSNWVRVVYNGIDGWLYTNQLRIKGNWDGLPVGDATTAPPAGSGGGAAPAGPTAPPGVPPTPAPPQNGDIISLNLYAYTDHVNYHRLMYWSDGLRVAGFLAEPKTVGKYPAVIFNRGGNRASGMLTGRELAPFAEAGFVTVASQYRGNGGGEGGEDFGGADVDDVLNLIALLKRRDNVDPNRIVMFGTSRGGMMTYIALKRLASAGSNDIKAAVSVSGIADLFMWSGEQPKLTKGVYADMIGGTVASNPKPYIDRLATYWPQLLRVPLLIQHGEADDVVSVKQSRALEQKIKAVGGPVKLLTYPGDGHSLYGHDEGLPEGLHWFQIYVGRAGDNFDFNLHKDAIYKAYAILAPK